MRDLEIQSIPILILAVIGGRHLLRFLWAKFKAFDLWRARVGNAIKNSNDNGNNIQRLWEASRRLEGTIDYLCTRMKLFDEENDRRAAEALESAKRSGHARKKN